MHWRSSDRRSFHFLHNSEKKTVSALMFTQTENQNKNSTKPCRLFTTFCLSNSSNWPPIAEQTEFNNLVKSTSFPFSISAASAGPETESKGPTIPTCKYKIVSKLKDRLSIVKINIRRQFLSNWIGPPLVDHQEQRLMLVWVLHTVGSVCCSRRREAPRPGWSTARWSA